MRSSFPDVEIPDQLLHQYILGELRPDSLDRVALVDHPTGTELTYRELLARIADYGALLSARGIGPGDTVAVFLSNSWAYPVVLYAILESGATVTTVNAAYTAAEVTHQLIDAGAGYLVADAASRSVAVAAATRAGIASTEVLSVPDLDAPGATEPPPGRPRREPDPTQVALLPYSSGTTGGPKGVMLTHRNIVANVAQTEHLLGVDATDTVLAVVPFAHIYGLSLVLCTTLRNRARLVPMARFDLAEYLSAIEKYRCTFLFVSPPIAIILAKDPSVDRYDLSSVHTIFSGAAPLDGDLATALERRLNCVVRQGYGMTELSPVSHLVPADQPDLPAGSVGILVPNARQKLIDIDTGAEIAPPVDEASRPGELLVAGPNRMVGYLGNAEATAATIDADGFLHTGDLATIGPRGVVTIVGRRKELIKVRGYQVAPAELEALLLSHDRIADAAVTGVPDGNGGELPCAWVVTTGEDLTAADVRAFVAEHVAEYKRLGAVEFIDRVPKSPAGKILRRELAGRPVSSSTTIVDRTMPYLTGGGPAHADLTPESGLLANGFDSLSVIELKNRLSAHYGVDITTTQLLRARSLRQLADGLGADSHQG